MKSIVQKNKEFATFDKAPDSAFIRVQTVAQLFGVSVVTIWRWVADGQMPAGIAIGNNTTRWRVGDIRKHMGSLK